MDERSYEDQGIDTSSSCISLSSCEDSNSVEGRRESCSGRSAWHLSLDALHRSRVAFFWSGMRVFIFNIIYFFILLLVISAPSWWTLEAKPAQTQTPQAAEL